MTDHHEVPLKNLSLLSMETILGYMTPEKVFEVAIESESFYKFGKAIKVPIKIMRIDVGNPSKNNIECLAGRRWFSFRSIKSKPVPNDLIKTRIIGRINGKPMALYKVKKPDLYSTDVPEIFDFDYTELLGIPDYCCAEVFSLVEMEDLTSHLLRRFRPSHFELSLFASASTMNCFLWNMQWYGIWLRCTSEYIITWEDLRHVLEHETATDVTLSFEFSTQYDSEKDNGLEAGERKVRDLEVIRQTRASLLDIPKIIKCEKFECFVFDFISVDDLINSQCKNIYLKDQVTPITNSEVNKLLKAWKKGEHLTNLEQLKFFGKKYKRTPEIIEGIEVHDEDLYHPNSMMNYRRWFEGFKRDEYFEYVIERETDNALASILIEDNYHIDVLVRTDRGEFAE